MNKELLKEMAKQTWCRVAAYFTHYLLPVIKDALVKTKDYFIETLWDSLKDEFEAMAKSAVDYVEYFYNSPSYKEKEEAAINTLFQNVDFPLILKPFKPLLKKILRNKVRKLIEKYLKKLHANL